MPERTEPSVRRAQIQAHFDALIQSVRECDGSYVVHRLVSYEDFIRSVLVLPEMAHKDQALGKIVADTGKFLQESNQRSGRTFVLSRSMVEHALVGINPAYREAICQALDETGYPVRELIPETTDAS